MNRIQLTRIGDALLLAVLVGLLSSFSWVAGLIVAVLGFWLGFLFGPRNYPPARQKDRLAPCHAPGDEEEDWWFYRHRRR